VVFILIDFDRGSLAFTLEQGGFKPNERSFFILEGVWSIYFVHKFSGGSLFLLTPDQLQVTDVDQQAASLAGDENRVHPINGIAKQGQSPEETEIPERYGNHAAALFFAVQPLYKETHRKKDLTRKSYRQPYGVTVQFLYLHADGASAPYRRFVTPGE
jgi:hypothetical protein